ncbi:hypothetical protein AAFF_G00078050 [Aldrovandia affinis]|uniref:Uncharacterized protein n=1 Tax=Aldrovandia affinis TaxID=143900 RepID=A0AAD7RXN7_9TELE|nr:hypothetical protein AAFF_G00078050 [Aldrovandia affinis]
MALEESSIRRHTAVSTHTVAFKVIQLRIGFSFAVTTWGIKVGQEKRNDDVYQQTWHPELKRTMEPIVSREAAGDTPSVDRKALPVQSAHRCCDNRSTASAIISSSQITVAATNGLLKHSLAVSTH